MKLSKNITILVGGISDERNISLLSGKNVLSHLRQKYEPEVGSVARCERYDDDPSLRS